MPIKPSVRVWTAGIDNDHAWEIQSQQGSELVKITLDEHTFYMHSNDAKDFWKDLGDAFSWSRRV